MKRIIVFAMALVAASTLLAKGHVHHGPPPPPAHYSHHHHHHHGSGGAIAAGIDTVQPNGTVIRTWQPGHYEQRTIQVQ